MNGDQKPVGERLATIEEALANLTVFVTREFKELKDLANPKLEKVDQLWEWKRLQERTEDARDKRISRYIVIGFSLMTVITSTVQIIIAVAK